jgi:hypothetical protein
MVLDAGQKEIGPKLCGTCGLLYSPGDFQDEEEHRKAHLKIDATFTLTVSKALPFRLGPKLLSILLVL